MTALLLVDIQNDFLPGGSLAVPKGDEILPLVNKLLKIPFDVVVATKDWHPPNHVSFIDLWPVHCVQNTHGAEFGSWHFDKVDKVFFKGTDPEIDSYGAFFDNEHKRSTGLGDFLKSKGIRTLYVAGLATDYCVRYSVLDALQLGFQVHVVIDACRGIDLVQEAIEEMTQAGAVLTTVSACRDKGKKTSTKREDQTRENRSH